jgi:hypothetical protein
MALILTKSDNSEINIPGTPFTVPSLYVFVTALFQGKFCTLNAIPFLNKERQQNNDPIRGINLPRKGNNPMGMVFECNEQNIHEAHQILKEFYEQNGFRAEIIDL